MFILPCIIAIQTYFSYREASLEYINAVNVTHGISIARLSLAHELHELQERSELLITWEKYIEERV